MTLMSGVMFPGGGLPYEKQLILMTVNVLDSKTFLIP